MSGKAVRAATRSCEFNSNLVHFILKSKFQNKSCYIVKFDLTTRFRSCNEKDMH